MRKYPIYTCNEHRVKHKIYYASLQEVSKKIFMANNFTTVTTHKNVQNYYSEKCTYNVNTHCNLLYALKVWNCSKLYSKVISLFN